MEHAHKGIKLSKALLVWLREGTHTVSAAMHVSPCQVIEPSLLHTHTHTHTHTTHKGWRMLTGEEESDPRTV